MSDLTPILGLPYLYSSQGTKQTYLNLITSLETIDTLTMLSVESAGLNSAPTNQNAQFCYIIGSNPVGTWANKAHQIARFINNGWTYYIPKAGFIAFDKEIGSFIVFDGSQWVNLPLSVQSFQNIGGIGISSNYDNTNPLSAKLNNALFSAKYESESGNGDVRIKLNKESSTKTASFLFQNNWSGRAEIGLCGGNNFSIKTSNNGTDWQTSIEIDNSTNKIKLRKPTNYINISDNQCMIEIENARFLHTTKPNNVVGDNLFLGVNSGSLSPSASLSWEACFNVGVGKSVMNSLISGYANVAVGNNALQSATSAADNVAVGMMALGSCDTGVGNTAVGRAAMTSNTGGCFNTAHGHYALQNNQTGWSNTAIGKEALAFKIDGSNNTNFSNCAGIGNGARVSGSNQVQLGDSSTTVYAYGAVQNRSDARDKTEIRDTILGLEFINALRPVDFKWDIRDDYFEVEEYGDEEAKKSQLNALIKDGSRKRNRFHHGLIAQEVEQVLVQMGTDFGGLQDHSINGGNDVKSIGYTELIAPLIKAVQELSERIEQIESSTQ